MAGHTKFLEKTSAPGARGVRMRETAPQTRVDVSRLRSPGSTRAPSASGGAGPADALQRLVGNQAVMRMLAVQRATADLREPSDEAIREAAAEGVRTPSTTLPYLDRIQASFGRHSIGDIQAHVGSAATHASQAMSARAYATGNHVVFGARPDLRTAAHEAAHVVQQRAGVHLAGGVGRVGDPYERRADAVADAVVAGRSAEELLGRFEGVSHMTTSAVTHQEEYSPSPHSQEARRAAALASVQRKIGFEFETPWEITKPSEVEWNTLSVLVEGLGWEISPDEIQGNSGHIEFKTKPLEVDRDNKEAMAKDVVELFKDLRTYTDRLTSVKDGAALPNANDKFTGVTVKPQDRLVAKPQVTGGVRTDRILNLLSDMASQRKEGDLLPNARFKGILSDNVGRVKDLEENSDRKKSREYWGTVSLLASYIQFAHYIATRNFTEAHEKKLEDVNESFHKRMKEVSENTGLSEQERQTEINELTKEREAGIEKIWNFKRPSYPKAVAVALPRIRFSKLSGITEPTLLEDVLQTAGLEKNSGETLLFLHGLVGKPDIKVTIAQWIKKIQEEDPQEPRNKLTELWSAREIESDDVGSGVSSGAAILLELRGFRGGVSHEKWINFAWPFFDYFRKLNRAKKPADT